MKEVVESVGRSVSVNGVGSIIQSTFVHPVTLVGSLANFLWNTILRTFRPAMSISLFLKQCEFVGNQSIGVMILAGMMIGAVFGLQFGEMFRVFGAEGMIGAAAGYALSKELAPVVGSFLVTILELNTSSTCLYLLSCN